MSNIYIQEPPTSGKVILTTSAGEIDIELWSKEAPKACRNFIQLCMEGYYDGTVFHRVVPEFIVQGGDPLGTGEGGESIYEKPFRDEFHTRLRFVRRGLVAMANSGKNDNGSQFFFTLATTPELQNKHTVFGKVVGDTLYNMLKLAEVELGENERPVHPHKIIRGKVISNPFEDIIPRTQPKSLEDDSEGTKKKKKSTARATKNFSLLSFGEEAEEDEEEVNQVSKSLRGKSKSSHDLEDTKLSSDPYIPPDDETHEEKESESESDDEHSGSESSQKKSDIENVRMKLKKQETSETEKSGNKRKAPSDDEDDDPDANTRRIEELKKEVQQLKKELMGKKRLKEKEVVEKKVESPPTNSLIAAFKADQDKYKEKKQQIGKRGSKREEATLAMLAKFQTKVESAKRMAEYADDAEEEQSNTDADDVESDYSWLGHKLQFEDKEQKVLDANVTDSERYAIFDPRNPLTKRRREASKQAMKEKKERR